MANQLIGEALDWVGTTLHLPEMGRSEAAAGGVPTTNTGVTQQSKDAGLDVWKDYFYGAPSSQQKQPISSTNTQSTTKQAGTKDTSGKSWKNGEWNGSKQYWDGSWYEGGYKAPSGDNNGGGGGGEPDYNEMYNPLLSYLSETEGLIGKQKESDIQDVNEQEASALRQYGDEQTKLLDTNASSQEAFNKTLRSALEDAIRGYNQLGQQNIARFGGGSSAGQAVGELANQEFLRQQGQIGQRGVEGTAQFETQKADIGKFITEKKTQLTEWKNKALRDIQNNYLAKLNDIQGKRYEVESNKSRDKINNLLDMRARVDSLKQADTAFRQNLAVAAINQLQAVSGKTFTPKEIKAYVTEFMSDLPSQVTSTGNAYANLARKVGTVEDELSSLTNT